MFSDGECMDAWRQKEPTKKLFGAEVLLTLKLTNH
jgi:hypothetical protein